MLTLPDRFWKWRMHGGAVTLARRFMADGVGSPDVVLATDEGEVTRWQVGGC